MVSYMIFLPVDFTTWITTEQPCTLQAVSEDNNNNNPQRGTAPYFRPMSIVAKRSPISATVELLLFSEHWNSLSLLQKMYFSIRYVNVSHKNTNSESAI